MTVASMNANIVVNPNIEEQSVGPEIPFSIDNPALLLKCISCIYYLIEFKKDQTKVQALLDSDSKVNVMTPAYAARLGFKIWPTNVEAQKINGSTFETFGMVLANF